MRLTTMLRQADPIPTRETTLSVRARAELRALVGTDPTITEAHPVSARPRRRRAVRALVLSGAALTVVAVFAVPLLQHPEAGVPAVPVESPTPTNSATAGATEAWVETAPGPLSGRRDAVTTWVDDSFLVVGGTTTPPCADPSGCDQDDILLADGARYTPANDTWTSIADAPTPLTQGRGQANPYPRTATIGSTLYVLQLEAFVAYNIDSDQWSTLPVPPEGAILAGATETAVVAYPASPCGDTATPCDRADQTTYYTYDPDTSAWSSQTVDLALPTNQYGAAVAGGHLVVSWVDGNTLGAATVDLVSGAVAPQPNLGTSQRPVPITVGDWAVWPRDEDTSWLLNTATQALSMIEMPTQPGPFRATVGAWEFNLPITTAGMIALNGHLYDPNTRLWSRVPALPIPTQDPIIATGSDAILACHGWDGAGYNAACYTIRPAPATQPTP